MHVMTLDGVKSTRSEVQAKQKHTAHSVGVCSLEGAVAVLD